MIRRLLWSSALANRSWIVETGQCSPGRCRGRAVDFRSECVLVMLDVVADIFSWAPTLACKARPSFDRCWSSLSVSLSLLTSVLFFFFGNWSWWHHNEARYDVDGIGWLDGVVSCNHGRRTSWTAPDGRSTSAEFCKDAEVKFVTHLQAHGFRRWR